MDKKYTIDSGYLKELIDASNRALVGKVCKRFEITSNPADLKSQIKELIYETGREFYRLLEVHQNGIEQQVWIFTNEQKKGKEE
jgi:hypothetical protein